MMPSNATTREQHGYYMDQLWTLLNDFPEDQRWCIKKTAYVHTRGASGAFHRKKVMTRLSEEYSALFDSLDIYLNLSDEQLRYCNLLHYCILTINAVVYNQGHDDALKAYYKLTGENDDQ